MSRTEVPTRWKPWIHDDHHPGGDGTVERQLPDGRVVKVPFHTDGPSLYRMLRRTMAYQYGEARWYEVDEIVYLSEGLARSLVRRRMAERVTLH
jgi:hypothetical protein